VRNIKRALMAIGVAFGAVVYLWVAAVRALPRIKRRKAKLRARGYGS
jgi:HAMP domain-containing protein